MEQDGLPYSLVVFFLVVIVAVMSFIGLIVTLVFKATS